MPLDHTQTTACRWAASMEKRASSWLYASAGRLHALRVLFDVGDPHCAQRNQKSFAYFLLVPVIVGNRRPFAGIVSAELGRRTNICRSPPGSRPQRKVAGRSGWAVLVHVCKFLDKSSVAQFLDRGLKGRLHFPWTRHNPAKREMQYSR